MTGAGSDETDIAVVYLAWGPLGADPIRRFVASYRRHPAGCPHRLLIVLKDGDAQLTATCSALAEEVGAQTLTAPTDGLDLRTYHRTAQTVHARQLMFLNTSSEILADGWLSAMAHVLDRQDVGLVGATGSYERLPTKVPGPLRALLGLRYLRFPNPHIRTNAFMLARELMLDLRWPSATRKSVAHHLESGPHGITRQILERGLRTLVVGRDGSAFDVDRWPASLTFRSGSQENLLVADNRTRAYLAADQAGRREQQKLTWGEPLTGG